MNTIVEIDKAGRIVVPKKFRDALHLTPGTRLRIGESRNGDGLTLDLDQPEPRLEMVDGLLVMTGGRLTTEDVNATIDEQRGRRMRYVAGLSDEP
ncbi:MAG: AbrB/MazE/SpoVT family DNA-binding domain-containing protein [Terracidiphilus sp.]